VVLFLRNQNFPTPYSGTIIESFPKFQLYVKSTLKTSVLHEKRLHMLSYLTDPALTYDYDVIDFIRLHVSSYPEGQLGARLKHAVLTA
jgi:hypothetical protein